MSNTQIKKSKKSINKKDIKPKVEKIDYEDFIEWVALPRPLRRPKTYEEFAKEHGMAKETLSRWKQKAGFWQDVSERIAERAKDRTSTVIEKLYQKIIKDGSAQEIKLWLQYIERWIPTEGVETRDKTFKDLIDEVSKNVRQQRLNKQRADRKLPVDTKQEGTKSEVPAESNTDGIRDQKDFKGSNT